MKNNEMMERVRIHLHIKMRDVLSLVLMWEMSISTLEELLMEGWNTMSDEDWIELNDIINIKKEIDYGCKCELQRVDGRV